MGRENSREHDKENLDRIRYMLESYSNRIGSGDYRAMQESAHLAKSAGKIAARIGRFGDAGKYYGYSAGVLKIAEKAGYKIDENFLRAMKDKSDKMYGIEKTLQERKERATTKRYAHAAATTVIILMIGGAFILMAPIMTGKVIGETAQKVSGVFGFCLFALGLIAGYIYLSRR
ncbi:MAG: hypothetical protein MUF61_00905 [archaeon]|jgi:hypothetical protein|nr:hypothetical protein [archaeon]